MNRILGRRQYSSENVSLSELKGVEMHQSGFIAIIFIKLWAAAILVDFGL